jgi:UDP-N-acetylmuramate dehydrogenase
MLSRLRAIPHVTVTEHVPLSECTRFAIGGPARFLIDVSAEQALLAVLSELRGSSAAVALIGGGTNLIVSDDGFPGAVLRYTSSRIEVAGSKVRVESGAVLQDLVDFNIERGLQGLETMTGIPGWVGGAIYGNAGAYGHAIQERIESVRFFDGACLREIGNAECAFAYRESIFKRRKDWIVISATLRLDPADPAALAATAHGILKIRNEKYPPSMRCAGSIFKNLILAELPEAVRAQVPDRVIREGKVPSAYFLEGVGAKGMAMGAIRVADYHANLIYNTGGGTAGQLRELIEILKSRVLARYGLRLEEEVQYIS